MKIMKRLDEIRQKLVTSGLSLLIFLLSYFISVDGHIVLIHPVFGLIGIFISSVLFSMFIFAFKREEKRKPIGDPDLKKLVKDLDIRLKVIESSDNFSKNEKILLSHEVRKMILVANDLYFKSLK
jgi:hypothetical protein